MSIQFIDLKAQQQRIKKEIDAAVQNVLDHGKYIMGPEIKEFEKQLCDYTGAKHAITCASGTDALALPLMAKGIKEGDAVFTPSFTFIATAEYVPLLGATPVFVDIKEDTFNMDPENLKTAIQDAKKQGLNPAGIIAVDLFGQPADYDELQAIAEENGMFLISDAAQSFGSSYKGKKAGGFCDMTSTSFFPAKPLGCYGDGGAVFTNDDELADILVSLRIHGKGTDKYDNIRIGMNGRMDTIQAAILIEKLKIFDDEMEKRQQVAGRYTQALKDVFTAPHVKDGNVSAWAQYTLLTHDRDYVLEACKEAGIPTAVYYPKPMHEQTAYKNFPCSSAGLEVSERLAQQAFSIPMHPYMDEQTQDFITDTLISTVKKKAA